MAEKRTEKPENRDYYRYGPLVQFPGSPARRVGLRPAIGALGVRPSQAQNAASIIRGARKDPGS
jgi:hypothetical protein